MLKCIVSDLDGTLLNDHHVLDALTIDCLTKCHERGIRFIVATGRGHTGMGNVLDVLPFALSSITCNGSEFYDEAGKRVFVVPIAKESLKQICACLDLDDYALECYYDDGVYTALDPEIIYNFYAKAFSRRNGWSDEEAQKQVHAFLGNKVYRHAESVEAMLSHQIVKMEFTFIDPETRAYVQKKLESIDAIDVTSSNVDNLEIAHCDATKGKMLERICTYYGYEENEVVVFGDSENDVSMLASFPNSYAVHNASDQAKAAASFLADDHAHQGVAKVILSLLENPI